MKQPDSLSPSMYNLVSDAKFIVPVPNIFNDI